MIIRGKRYLMSSRVIVGKYNYSIFVYIYIVGICVAFVSLYSGKCND